MIPADRGWVIRAEEAEDRESLLALERESPEQGALGVRLDLHFSHAELARRFPAVEGYVAVPAGGACARASVAGVVFCSLAPTQWRGAVVPAAYLFSLRVHPEWRRRGVASALIEHAWSRAVASGAALAWALVAGGNKASLPTFVRAGFTSLGDGRLRLVLPSLAVPPLPRRPGGHYPPGTGAWHMRRAEQRDLPALALALNDTHARHNLWRPCNAGELAAQLAVPGHGPAHVLLALNGDDIAAAGAVLHTGRIARLRLLPPMSLPPLVQRIAAPLLARVPFQPRVLRHRLLPAIAHGGRDGQGAGQRLLTALAGSLSCWASPLLVSIDPYDPAWQLIRRVRGTSTRLHVIARLAGGALPQRGDRPLYLG
ncbi:MAG TPA: GNAT family N-acetyltransferase [Chloroflexota bacterium]|nr:GNAT family N-acetyltransferase [Chloroflexota bacterium]